MTCPPSGVITCPSISQAWFAHLFPSLPFHFLLSSLEKNYLDGGKDWLSWGTIWCLFQLKWNCLVPTIPLAGKHRQRILWPHDDLQYHIRTFNVLPVQIEPCVTAKKSLKLICKPPSQQHCCSTLVCEINFTPYSCKWWLACHRLGLPAEREAKQRQPEVGEAQDRREEWEPKREKKKKKKAC